MLVTRHIHGDGARPSRFFCRSAWSSLNSYVKMGLSYVKSCEGSSCTLLFMDRARGRARRWCSMAICGNRAKQIAHRNRRKANP